MLPCGEVPSMSRSKKHRDEVQLQLEEAGGIGFVERLASRQSAKYVNKYVAPKDRDEVSDAEHTMRVWGVDPNKNDHHKWYWDIVKQTVRDHISHRGASWLFDVSPSHLYSPGANSIATIRAICWQEIGNMVYAARDNKLSEIRDLLKKSHPDTPYGPPFYQQRGAYHVKAPFLCFEENDLDPFNRFMAFEGTAEDILRRQFQSNEPAGASRCSSMLLFAMAIIGACKKSSCNACLQHGTLRWNKANHKTVQWRKMECENCGALYEFKATPDLRMKMQEGILSVDGGTLFGSYHALKREEKRMFLVLVDSNGLGASSARMRSVFVAPIEHVSPCLKPRSFILRHGPIRVFTKIFIGAIDEWFTLDPIVPVLEESTPVQFVSDVIDDYFHDFNVRHGEDGHRNDEDDKGNGATKVDVQSMSRGDLQEYRRDVKKKWIKLTRIIKMKQPEELTEEEITLVKTRDHVKAEVDRCDELWVALYL
jgi:hypothetical protein